MEKQELIREAIAARKRSYSPYSLPGGRGAAGKIRESIHGMQH